MTAFWLVAVPIIGEPSIEGLVHYELAARSRCRRLALDWA